MYYQIYKNILMPFYEKIIKRRKILDYRRVLEQSQWWNREQLLDFQWKELKNLIDHAYIQSPYWREVFKQRGLHPEHIKSPEDFRKLPIITKDDIRANKSEMIARNYLGKTWTKSTGGSTGVPLELDYTSESFDWRTATTKRGYGWAGCEDGIKQAYIWGTDIKEPPPLTKFKRNLHHAYLRQKYYNCFVFTNELMAEYLADLNRFKPKVIVGYTNPLYNFAQFVAKSGGVKFKPEAIITGAEKLHEFQRQDITEVFGCPVFNTYGSREFMLIACECEKHKGLHVSMENLYVEIIKEDGTQAKEGEMGDIVISDLHNYGMPFLRYKIGDMAVATNRNCSCGRGLTLLEDVVGRQLDMIRTPKGRFVPGEFFPHLMKEFKGVARFQVIQEKLNELIVKIIKNESFKDSDFQFMKAKILKVMDDESMNIKFEFVSEIPLTQTGKFRVTISKLGSDPK